LIFDFKIVSENDTSVNLNKAPEDGNYIYGLFLDGARWDNDTNTMNEQNPK
jgi:dynein heavy chain